MPRYSSNLWSRCKPRAANISLADLAPSPCDAFGRLLPLLHEPLRITARGKRTRLTLAVNGDGAVSNSWAAGIVVCLEPALEHGAASWNGAKILRVGIQGIISKDLTVLTHGVSNLCDSRFWLRQEKPNVLT
jgi:hypothetical protein